MAEIVPSVKNQEKGHIWNYWKRINENKTKLEIVVFSIFENKMDRTWSGLRFEVLERERESAFSLNFSVFRPSVRSGQEVKLFYAVKATREH